MSHAVPSKAINRIQLIKSGSWVVLILYSYKALEETHMEPENPLNRLPHVCLPRVKPNLHRVAGCAAAALSKSCRAPSEAKDIRPGAKACKNHISSTTRSSMKAFHLVLEVRAG